MMIEVIIRVSATWLTFLGRWTADQMLFPYGNSIGFYSKRPNESLFLCLDAMSYQLMQGDCLELMKQIPDGSVDCIVADPPYGIDFQSQRKKDKSKWMPKIANDKNPFVEWLPESFRCLVDGGVAIVFCRWDVWIEFSVAAIHAGYKIKEQIVWDKLNHGTGDLKGAPGSRHEIAMMLTKGRFIFHGKRPQTVLPFAKVSAQKLVHPNEKPVSLMESIVSSYCKEGGMVLDPFTGVSPVGVACANTGRNFIGIEQDAKYFEIAKDRIESASLAKAA
jgi:site-specific DNA-methyltransferase (adenine-specific)